MLVIRAIRSQNPLSAHRLTDPLTHERIQAVKDNPFNPFPKSVVSP